MFLSMVDGCTGTAPWTYTTAFSHTPQVLSQSNAALATSVSTTAVTITGSAIDWLPRFGRMVMKRLLFLAFALSMPALASRLDVGGFPAVAQTPKMDAGAFRAADCTVGPPRAVADARRLRYNVCRRHAQRQHDYGLGYHMGHGNRHYIARLQWFDLNSGCGTDGDHEF